MHQKNRVGEPRLQTSLGTIWRISILAVLLAGCSGPSNESQVPGLSGSVDPQYADPASLVEVATLREKVLELKNTVLIDVRKPEDFSGGHIRNARNIWRDQITDASYNYGGMMASKAQMESLFSELGVQSSDTIILYDAKADVDAARLWWILKYYGHDQVQLLNGGLRSWVEEGGELDSAEIDHEPTKYEFDGSVDPKIYASIDHVKKCMETSDHVILDTRSTEEFSGEIRKKGAAVAGAIPSAVNLDWAVAVNYESDYRFRSAQELEKIYGEAGIDSESKVITYCHSGVRSAHTLFVLTQLLGYTEVRNYDGSWTEWSHLTD